MQVTVMNVLVWASGVVANVSEPVVLLVLGGLFLALSFSVRSRQHIARVSTADVATTRKVSPVGSALATQQGH